MVNHIESYCPSEQYALFWMFATKRHQVFIDRLSNPCAKSDDPILARYKFTNTFRFLDRTSQYLITHIINDDAKYSDADMFFRILLYKIFNRINTWETLQQQNVDIKWESGIIARCMKILDVEKNNGKKIYSPAYIMPSGTSSFGSKTKHHNHLVLLERIMNQDPISRIKKMTKLQDLYDFLVGFDTIGPFLAYQYSIDINYSRLCNFSEDDFVMAGPGALRGIKRAFLNDEKPEEMIKFITQNQDQLSVSSGYAFHSRFNRKLHLIDVQNLFCEFDKYMREYTKSLPEPEGDSKSIKGKRIKQLFIPNTDIIHYVFPKKWGELEVK